MKTLVIKYDTEIIKSVSNKRIIVELDSLEDLEVKYAESQRCNQVMAMVVKMPYTSVSQIDFKEEWANIPLMIRAYNIGDYDMLFFKLDTIRRFNARIYLTSKSASVYTDLKVLSSLGIDCGIWLEDEMPVEDDKLLDLASFYYMSQARHATIEPFEFIMRHLNEEHNISFDAVYFTNPLMYQHVESAEEIPTDETLEHDDFKVKMETYYKHFIDLDDCAKCPAFKICNYRMNKVLTSCSTTMNEVFEYAEIRNEMNRNQAPRKTICQL